MGLESSCTAFNYQRGNLTINKIPIFLQELDAHFKENFPTHRPSIAMLTTYKRVTTNVARLEKNREVGFFLGDCFEETLQEEQEAKENARTSLQGRNSMSRRISSGSKSFTKESEGFKT